MSTFPVLDLHVGGFTLELIPGQARTLRLTFSDGGSPAAVPSGTWTLHTGFELADVSTGVVVGSALEIEVDGDTATSALAWQSFRIRLDGFDALGGDVRRGDPQTTPGDETVTVNLADGGSVEVTAVLSGAGGAGAVTSVNGQTGVVVLAKTDVGLGLVDNTSDASKPVSTLQAAADTAVASAAASALSAGLATKADLVAGKVPSSQIPAIATTETYVVASQAAMLALGVEVGDLAIRSDLKKTFILGSLPATVLGNWIEFQTPTDSVLSVNGQTGVVVLGKANVGLGSVDNTDDMSKPVSTAQAAADAAVLGAAVQLTGAQSVAGIKTFSAPPVVPTATAGDSSTKAASTAFVTTADNLKANIADLVNVTGGDGINVSSGVVSIPSNGVVTSMVADAQVTTAKIDDVSVSTAKIIDAAVTNAKLAGLAVSTAKIVDAAVSTVKIADSAVTTAKIADASISAAKADSTEATRQGFHDVAFARMPAQAIRSADSTAVNNSITFVADSVLTLAVLANTVYVMDAFIMYSTGVTPDIAIGWLYPTSTTMSWTGGGIATSGSTTTGSMDFVFKTQTGTVSAGGHASSTLAMRPSGIVRVGATAGNLQLRFAQATADPTDTVIKADSFLRLTRVS